jgi:hypothetical protein
MESEVVFILTGRRKPKPKTCKDYGYNSWVCWLLGFHIKAPWEN